MPEYENHRVTRVDVITAVDMVSVDAEAEPCHNFDHPLEELGERERPVKLLGALVVLVGLGERRDPHGHRPVHVEEPDDEEAPPQHNPPENRNF